jgi:hypothetical protein
MLLLCHYLRPLSAVMIAISHTGEFLSTPGTYFRDPLLWVSRWPDGEPLAGLRPAVASVGEPMAFPIGPSTKSFGSDIFRLPTLLPKPHDSLSSTIYLHLLVTQVKTAPRNDIT